MKSIIFGLSLVSAAVAQVSVLGMSMVPIDASGSPAASSSGASVTPTPTPTDGGNGGGYGGAAPSVPTTAPSVGEDFYSYMPYSSYQSGGYKTLNCGYGYSKQSDGSCHRESWVRPLFSNYYELFSKKQSLFPN